MNRIAYIRYTDIINNIGIQTGDIILISSDIVKLSWTCKENNDIFDANLLLDSIISKIGDSGTLILPTYNWDFCKGIQFDYFKTKSKTGILGQVALKRDDFMRTKHPIYSYAVWGRDKGLLCELDNQSAFGKDSPFAYMHHNKAKNILIDVDYKNCFTYVHYVEEQVGNISYRYLKNFSAQYKDKNNKITNRTYSMFVRDLDMDVQISINPLGKILEYEDVSKKYVINNSEIIKVDLYDAYSLIVDDIINNQSRNICSYIGQED